jgi:hypothetical protein
MKYGERYAKALWRNELLDLSSLNLSNELDQYKFFDEHCSLVNDVISCESLAKVRSITSERQKISDPQVANRLPLSIPRKTILPSRNPVFRRSGETVDKEGSRSNDYNARILFQKIWGGAARISQEA